MQNDDTVHDEIIQTPNSNVTGRRLFALLIDSFVLALLIGLATRSFGIAQPGNVASIPGALSSASGTFYGVSDGSAGSSTMWTIALVSPWPLLLVLGYFVLLETLFGATLGKASMGLRVISEFNDHTYGRATFKAVLIRNIIRFIDALPSAYLVGWVTAMISSRRRRLGDIAAHTLVVSRDSVPDLVRSRKQTRINLLMVTAICMVFVIACQTFVYFGHPPLIIQNAIAIRTMFPTDHIISYTLGEKTWGQEERGQQTVTYPISFISVNQLDQKKQTCQGEITLTWHWFDLDWTESSSSTRCTDL